MFGSSCTGNSSWKQESSFGGFAPSSQPVFGCPTAPTFGTTSAPFGSSSNTSASNTTTVYQGSNLFAPSNDNSASASSSSTTFSFIPPFGRPCNSIFGVTGMTSPAQAIGSMTSSPSSPHLSFGNLNPTSSLMSGCGFLPPNSATASSRASTQPEPTFNFSTTPLYSFSNIPSSQSSQPSQSSTSTFKSEPQTATPTLQVCPRCGHTSFWGQHWGSRVAAYIPTPAPDLVPFAMPVPILSSISAMRIYQGKSHEELRFEDYQSRGKTQEWKTPLSESASFVYPLFDVPILILPMMPTLHNSCGFGAMRCSPVLGSSIGLNSSAHSGTSIPGFADPPTFPGAPLADVSVLVPHCFPSSSTRAIPAAFPFVTSFAGYKQA